MLIHEGEHITNQIITVLRTILIFLIVVAIILSNIINIYMLRKTHELQLFSRLLLINLSVAGLINGCVVCFPGLIASTINKWPFGELFCKIESVSHGATCAVTIWCLAAISLDRYVAIHQPIFYRNSNKARFAIVIITMFWIVGIFFFAVPLFQGHYGSQYNRHLLICSMVRDVDLFGIVSGCVVYVVSAVILFLSSYKVMLSLRKVDIENINRHGKLRTTRNANAIRILIISGVSFFVSWGPFTITDFLISLKVIYKIPEGMDFIITWMANSNSFMNVLIYSGASTEYRRRLKYLFQKYFTNNIVELPQMDTRTSIIMSSQN